MNNFSFSRLYRYTKTEIMTNRYRLLLWTAGATIYFVLTYLTYYLKNRGIEIENDVFKNLFFKTPYILSIIFIMVLTLINVSTSFTNYYNKDLAGAYMMLPASQGEKFSFALIFNQLLVPAVLILIAYIVHLCFSLLYGIPSNFFSIESPRVLFDISILVFASLSPFFLGAIFFRRHQFLYTLISLFCINIILGYVGYLISLFDYGWLENIIINMNWKEYAQQIDVNEAVNYMRIGAESIGILFTAVMWYLSWRSFKRLQITK